MDGSDSDPAMTLAVSTAREEVRRSRNQRNRRVETWRLHVAKTASECTCTNSSPSSSMADSSGPAEPNAKPDLSNSSSSGTQAKPRTTAKTSYTSYRTSFGTSVGNRGSRKPSHENQDALVLPKMPADKSLAENGDHGSHEAQKPGRQCHECSRLGAPRYFGQCELDEDLAYYTRRHSAVNQFFKNVTRRLNFLTKKKHDPSKAAKNVDDPDTRRASQEKTANANTTARSRSEPINKIKTNPIRNKRLDKVTPRVGRMTPPSVDSFVASRRAKMEENWRAFELRNKLRAGWENKESPRRGIYQQDLDKVNDILSSKPGADVPEHATKDMSQRRKLKGAATQDRSTRKSPNWFGTDGPAPTSPQGEAAGPASLWHSYTWTQPPAHEHGQGSDAGIEPTTVVCDRFARTPSSISPRSRSPSASEIDMPSTSSITHEDQDPVVAYKHKQARRGLNRLQRAQRLLEQQRQRQRENTIEAQILPPPGHDALMIPDPTETDAEEVASRIVAEVRAGVLNGDIGGELETDTGTGTGIAMNGDADVHLQQSMVLPDSLGRSLFI